MRLARFLNAFTRKRDAARSLDDLSAHLLRDIGLDRRYRMQEWHRPPRGRLTFPP